MRRGLKGFALLVVVFVLGTSVLAACASPAPSPTATSSAPAAPTKPTAAPTTAPAAPAAAPAATAAKPAAPAATAAPAAATKPTGTLNVAVASLWGEQWTEWSGGSASEMALMSSVYDYLLYIDEQGGLKPGLAESYTISPDGKTYDFTLRKGVKFHGDWGEFTAEDAKFSIDFYARKDSKAIRAGLYQQWVDNVEVVDPYRVRLTLKAPNSEMIYILSNWLWDQQMLSKKYIDKVGPTEASLKPIGTGPYRFVEHKPGDYVKLEALDSHWRVVPAYHTVVVKVVPEESTRLAMVQKGEIDFAPISLSFKKEAEKMALKILRVPRAAQLHIHFAGTFPIRNEGTFDPTTPWATPGNYNGTLFSESAYKVRLAMELSIDKQAVLEDFLQGEGELLPAIGYWAGSKFAPADMKVRPYDPATAKKLMAEAGFPNGFGKPIRFWQMSAGTGAGDVKDLAEVAAMYWDQNLGIKTQIVPTDYGTIRPFFSGKDGTKTAWTVWAWAYATRFSEPFQMWTRMGLLKSTLNLYYDDQESQQLADKAVAEPDPQKRFLINQQLGMKLYTNALDIPLATKNALYVVSNKVSKLPMLPGSSYIDNLEYITP